MAEAVAGKDIAAPGTTPAPATSKPVIVGHTSQVADPMVSGAPAPEPNRPKLTPSDEAVKVAEVEAAKPVKDERAADELAIQAQEERDAKLQELIESGEYNVSIGNKAGKHSVATFMLTALIIVVVGAVALFVLTDLKLIDPGFDLPFHIFN